MQPAMALVTAVRADPPRTPRRAISLDHDPWRVTSSAVLKRVNVAVGDMVDPDALDATLDAAEHYLARARALRLLARAERGSAELSGKLVAEGYAESVVADLVDSLVRADLVSDERFAEALGRTLTLSKRYGRRRVLGELRRRGLDELHVQGTAEHFCSPEQEAARAHDVAGSLVARHDTFDRLASALLRRGFDHDTAADAARAQLRDRP